MLYISDIDSTGWYHVKNTRNRVTATYDISQLRRLVSEGVEIAGYLSPDVIVPLNRANTKFVYEGIRRDNNIAFFYLYRMNVSFGRKKDFQAEKEFYSWLSALVNVPQYLLRVSNRNILESRAVYSENLPNDTIPCMALQYLYMSQNRMKWHTPLSTNVIPYDCANGFSFVGTDAPNVLITDIWVTPRDIRVRYLEGQRAVLAAAKRYTTVGWKNCTLDDLVKGAVVSRQVQIKGDTVVIYLPGTTHIFSYKAYRHFYGKDLTAQSETEQVVSELLGEKPGYIQTESGVLKKRCSTIEGDRHVLRIPDDAKIIEEESLVIQHVQMPMLLWIPKGIVKCSPYAIDVPRKLPIKREDMRVELDTDSSNSRLLARVMSSLHGECIPWTIKEDSKAKFVLTRAAMLYWAQWTGEKNSGNAWRVIPGRELTGTSFYALFRSFDTKFCIEFLHHAVQLLRNWKMFEQPIFVDNKALVYASDGWALGLQSVRFDCIRVTTWGQYEYPLRYIQWLLQILQERRKTERLFDDEEAFVRDVWLQMNRVTVALNLALDRLHGASANPDCMCCNLFKANGRLNRETMRDLEMMFAQPPSNRRIKPLVLVSEFTG